MPFPGCVPELTDGVVRLRAHRPDDAEAIVEQSIDPESVRWTTVPRPYALEQAREFLAIIESGWTPRQRTTVTTLAGAGAAAVAASVRPPAVVVIGEVVRIRAELEALGADFADA